MTEAEKREASAYYKELFDEAADLALFNGGAGTDALCLDEVCAAVNSGLLQKEQVLAFLDRCPDSLEIVMTGAGTGAGVYTESRLYIRAQKGTPSLRQRGAGKKRD